MDSQSGFNHAKAVYLVGLRMKVGIIGCGAIAARAHIPAFERAGASVLAVADTDMNRTKGLARKFKIPNAYSDFHELLEEDLDVISICTPPKTHASIAIEVASKRKNILVEKPMTTSLSDAEHLVETCASNKIKLCVLHQYRFLPCVQQAKRRVSNGRLGNIVSIHMTAHPQFPMRWSDSQWLFGKWSLLDDVGAHLIDVLSFLTEGSPINVSAFAHDSSGKMGFYDSFQIMIELGDSRVAYLDLSWITGSVEFTAQIFGTGGKLTLDLRNNFLSEIHGYVTPFDEMSATLHKSTRTIVGALTKRYFRGTLLYHDFVIKSFLESICNDTEPPVGPREGMRIVEFLEKIKLSCA